MQVDLTNRVALVTGAARGIGRAVADAMVANGATVVYADLDQSAAAEAAAASAAGRGVGLAMNVTDEAQVEDVIARVVRDHGSLDILVNNAGVNTMEHRVTIDRFPRAEWDRILDVDLTGVYLVARAASKSMLAAGKGGRVINIASVLGIVPARLQCAYVAAKAGVINLTRAMAIELGSRGVLTNCIAPGSILTQGTRTLFYGDDGTFKHSVQKLLDHIPLGRPGSVEEVAHAALFLAAPESSYINGAVLTVDGGWTAGYAREF